MSDPQPDKPAEPRPRTLRSGKFENVTIKRKHATFTFSFDYGEVAELETSATLRTADGAYEKTQAFSAGERDGNQVRLKFKKVPFGNEVELAVTTADGGTYHVFKARAIDDKSERKVLVCRGRFVDAKGGTPVTDHWVHTSTPGDPEAALGNTFKPHDPSGLGGWFQEGSPYSFHFGYKKLEADALGALKADQKVEQKAEAPSQPNPYSAQAVVFKVEVPPLKFEVQINDSADAKARYVGWAPSPCSVQQTGGNAVEKLTLRCKAATGKVGKLSFYEDKKGAPAQDELTLEMPADKSAVKFRMGGKFGHPSFKDKDTILEVVHGTKVIESVPLMVRVRKNANTLETEERDLFLKAYGALNKSGFQPFHQIHTQDGEMEAHYDDQFLLWHRAFLLDLERELQALEPATSLHYWRFDEPAPNVFTADFMGAPPKSGRDAFFNPGNPLSNWKIDGRPGIYRSPNFPIDQKPPRPISQAATLALGSSFPRPGFAGMEGNPHGAAHMSFTGTLTDITAAAQDPIFFMLHCNVDRLWAAWQQQNKRFDASSPQCYTQGSSKREGHNLDDTMWPWNGKISAPARPLTAPGGTFPTSLCATAPTEKPKVREMVDYQGVIDPKNRLGMDYDNVAYTPA